MSRGLLVRQLLVAPEFESSFFVYDLGSGQYQKDYYNQFLIPPSRMLTNLLQENLYNTGLFLPVLSSEPQDIDYRLWGKIVHLYVDMKDITQPYCVLSIRLRLDQKVRSQEAGGHQIRSKFVPVLNQYYQARIPVKDHEPKAMALAWGDGLKNILMSFQNDAGDILDNFHQDTF